MHRGRVAAMAVLFPLLAACAASGGSTVAPSPMPTSPATSSFPVVPPDQSKSAATWPAPDNQTTPGAIDPNCAKQRDVSSKLQTLLRTWYHIPGKVNEYDHRVPKFLCGADESACPAAPDWTCPAARSNIWPQTADDTVPKGFIHNRKDELELVVSSKLRHGDITTGQAVAVFAAPSDWRRVWCFGVVGVLAPVHKLGDGVDCTGLA